VVESPAPLQREKSIHRTAEQANAVHFVGGGQAVPRDDRASGSRDLGACANRGHFRAQPTLGCLPPSRVRASVVAVGICKSDKSVATGLAGQRLREKVGKFRQGEQARVVEQFVEPRDVRVNAG
jgi:hypothetical protein